MDFESLFGTTEDDGAAVNHDAAGSQRGEGTFGLRVRRPHSSLTLIEVVGPLDLAALDRFDEEVRNHLTGRRTRLVLDLSAVTFLSAGGIDTMLDLDEQTRAQGKQLILVTGTHPVDRPLQALGLMHRFTFGDSPWPESDSGQPPELDGTSDIAAVANHAELQHA